MSAVGTRMGGVPAVGSIVAGRKGPSSPGWHSCPLSAKSSAIRRDALAAGSRRADADGMEQKGLRTGHFVALAGAVAAFGSLWRPWYTISIPSQLRDLLGSSGRLGQDPGLLGQMARGIAAALPSSLSASGWRELEGADVALCLGAVAVVALVLGAAGALGPAVRVDPGACGTIIAAVGVAGLAIAIAHLVHPPGGS